MPWTLLLPAVERTTATCQAFIWPICLSCSIFKMYPLHHPLHVITILKYVLCITLLGLYQVCPLSCRNCIPQHLTHISTTTCQELSSPINSLSSPQSQILQVPENLPYTLPWRAHHSSLQNLNRFFTLWVCKMLKAYLIQSENTFDFHLPLLF